MLSMHTRRTGRRNANGAVLAEATASTVIFVSLVVVLMFVMIQSCVCLHILNGLTQGARDGAREMALLYLKSGGGDRPNAAAINTALSRIQVPGVVNQSSQFSVVWPTNYSRNSHPQPCVTVTCFAAMGQAGSNGSANIKLPFGKISFFGKTFSLQDLSLKASATYALRP